MAFNRLTILMLWLLGWSVQAQDNRYMVFFKDKVGTPYDIAAPEQFLGDRAIARRNKQLISITAQDLPVNQEYIQGVKNIGVDVMFSTRWMNGILIQGSATEISSIEALPYVLNTELVAPGEKPSSSGRRKYTTRRTGTNGTQPTDNQLTMIGIDEMHGGGYHGEGLNIAVFDAGFEGVNLADPFQHIFTDGRINVNVSYDFVFDEPDVFRHDDHGTGVFSVIAAYLPDAYTGGAYNASYQLYVTEDVRSEYRIEEYNWLFAAERADSAGVDIVNSSLGYNLFDDTAMNYSKSDLDGETAVVSKAAKWLSERGVIVVVSAGNEGNNSWGLVTPPADNELVFSIGAVNNAGLRAQSSSTGPTADNRIKPDVAAMGVGVSIVKPNGTVGVSSGTSFAAPLITSLVAGVWQRYPALKNTEIMSAIRSSASQASSPDNLLGYGIPNFKAVVNMLEWKPQEKPIEIFPNPVIDTLSIRPISPVEITTCRIEIVSLQGQILANKQIDFNWLDRVYQTDCSELAAGMYLLRIWMDQEIFSYKFIKL